MAGTARKKGSGSVRTRPATSPAGRPAARDEGAAGWLGTLDALAELRQERHRLARLEAELVVRARRDEIPWRMLAESLGISPQAAHQRYAQLVDRP